MEDELLVNLKQKVKNYKDKITGEGVPYHHLCPTLLVDMQTLSDFVAKNPNANGVRIYYSKNAMNPLVDNDYDLILVPYMTVTSGGDTINQDDLSDQNKIEITPCCKQPPGCSLTGALLL